VAAAATLIGVTLGGMQLWRSLHGPNLVVVIDSEDNVYAPKVREHLRTSFTHDELTQAIAQSEKAKDRPAVTLTKLKEKIEQPKSDFEVSLIDLRYSVSPKGWHLGITNDSSSVAKDVKLVLPGMGMADIFEANLVRFDSGKPPIEWNRELQIGTIPSHGRVDVLIWPDDVPLPSLTDENTAILYSDGSGSIRQMRHFYGWDADFVNWFLLQPGYFRYGSLLILMTGITGVVIWRKRRKQFLNKVAASAEPPREPAQTA